MHDIGFYLISYAINERYKLNSNTPKTYSCRIPKLISVDIPHQVINRKGIHLGHYWCWSIVFLRHHSCNITSYTH